MKQITQVPASSLSFKFKLSTLRSIISGEGNPLVYFKDSADALFIGLVEDRC